MSRRPDEREAAQQVQTPIERMQDQLRSLERVLPVRPVPRGDGARDLDERLSRDITVLTKYISLNEMNWIGETPEGRRLILEGAEQRLATAQGREPFRVYAVDLKPLAPDERTLVLGATNLISEKESFRHGHAKGAYIHIDQRLLTYGPENGRPSTFSLALEMFLEESRHAYQLSVLASPNRHPEVPRTTVGLWSAAHSRYGQDVASDSGYKSNAIEQDAKQYRIAVHTAFYEKCPQPFQA